MTKIAMRFVTTTDIPIGDALVAIRLTRSDYEEKTSGVIMTRLEEFHTDANGLLQVDLLPAKHLYHVTVYDTVQDIAIHHDFLVPEVPDPNTVLRLQDLIVPPDTVLSSMPFDVEAMQKIQQAKAEAQAAATEAKAAAELVQGAIDTTTENAAITTADRIAVESMRNEVSADALEVHQNTVLVADYTGDALQHKIDAQAAASTAVSSATAAQASEQQAIQSAAAAKISEGIAAESITVSQAAVNTTLAARDATLTARDVTTAAKDVTVDAKNVTLQKAAELEAQLYAFNEIYIGKFASHPTVDGNGNPLKIGAIYENTTEGKLYQYESDLQWHPYDEESQQQMNNALLSANSAAASAGSSAASMNAAETARLAAVAAKTSSETAAITATNSAATAVAAKDATVAAKDTAVAAKDTASQKAVDAAASAAAAAASAAIAAIAADYQIPSDWTQTDNTKKDFIKNKPVLATVATSGNKSDVGLGNVDNTSDVNKPVSTPQATALAGKANLAGSATQDFNVASLNGSFIGGMRNRIINGDMRINQRNIPNSGADAIGYTLDCWANVATVGAKISYGPNRYNVATRPPGFPNYLGFGPEIGAYSAGAAEPFLVQQSIEGNNLADLQYGSTGAKTCTLTAWVLSNMGGTHSGAVHNALGNKSFVFTFSLAADTWTLISITVPGDTASAMNVNHLRGLDVRFNLGSGSSYLSATTGSWITGDIVGASGAVNMLASNAYFLFTGVQFEAGQATPFSRRSIAEELAMCQYYFETGEIPITYISAALGVTIAYSDVRFTTTKRVPPSIGYSGAQYFSGVEDTSFTPGTRRVTASHFVFTGAGLTNWTGWAGGTWTASSEI